MPRHIRPAEILLLVLPLLLPIPARAIVNIEDSALNRPDAPFSATVDVALRGNSGNSDRVGLSADGGMQWRRGAHQSLLWLGYDYGSSQKKRNANRGFAHLRHRYHFSPRYAGELFGQWQKDEFARLNRRILLGGGARITIEKQHLGLGAFHEREQINLAANDPGTPNPTLWRGNIYLALHHKFGTASFNDTLYYQPALRRSGDYRLLNEAAIRLPVSTQLSLKLSLELRQDSRPPLAVKKTDIRYSTAFSISLP